VHVVAINPAEDGDLAGRLLAIQRAAYGVEASLIGDDRIPPLHEDADELLAAPLNWLGAFDKSSCLIGAVAWVEQADEVDIDRLVVDPMAHRRGVGRELVRSVLSRAGSCRTTVSTGRRNLPARTLYLSLGFVQMEDTEVETGLWITHFARVP